MGRALYCRYIAGDRFSGASNFEAQNLSLDGRLPHCRGTTCIFHGLFPPCCESQVVIADESHFMKNYKAKRTNLAVPMLQASGLVAPLGWIRGTVA